MKPKQFFLIVLIITTACMPMLTGAAEPSLEEAKNILSEAAEKNRLTKADMTFEEFKKSVFKEPFEGGKYIVNGDTPIVNEKQLKEFFEKNVKNKPAARSADIHELVVHQVGGLDAIWNIADQHRLTYCVSSQFSERHTQVAAAMESATRSWEAVADIDFIYLGTEDPRCTATNTNLTFDVRPVNVSGRYLARAFFPNEPRQSRNVLIDESSFHLDPNGNLTLVAILRHELGHTLGFRHEHTRPDSGACFEDEDWRPITDYDPLSVMHYPQCNGLGDWSLTLTPKDMSGAACLYGAAPGFTIDVSVCGGGNTPATKTVEFYDEVVKKGKENPYPTEALFKVKPGTQFIAEMRASGENPGDPDLYLKFNDRPQQGWYDCRPYLVGPDETCSVVVPQGSQLAAIMVRGYTQGSYDLTVTYTEPN